MKKAATTVLAIVLLASYAFIESGYFSSEDPTLKNLYEQGISDEMVSFTATVEKILADDLQGSRHQRMILRIGQQTVLLAHNIDLAEKVPVEVGDTVSVYGEYEWNDKGGVVHWTHKDPRNKHPHGWVKHQGKTYQ